MIPEFAHTPEFAKKMKAWSTIRCLDLGMTQEQGTAMYGLTPEEVEPYIAEYRELHK